MKKIPLKNGINVIIHDQTYRYYGDFYIVKLAISCEVDVLEEFFADLKDFDEARNLLGEKAIYRRTVEQMGVPSTGIERAREILIQNFTEHSLPYFSLADFPRKFILSQYVKAKRKLSRLPA